jgi:hypothetical protein
MIRVVIDANVTSRLWSSAARLRAIQRAQGEGWLICISKPIIDEVAGRSKRSVTSVLDSSVLVYAEARKEGDSEGDLRMRAPRLKFLHPAGTLNRVKLENFRRLSTEELRSSLMPNAPGSLKVRPDGTVLDGHLMLTK